MSGLIFYNSSFWNTNVSSVHQKRQFCILVLSQEQLKMEITQGSLHLFISVTQWLVWSHLRPHYLQDLTFWYPSLAIISNLSYHLLSVEFTLPLYWSLHSVLLSLFVFSPDILNKDIYLFPHLYKIGLSQRKTWHILFSCFFYSIINTLIPKLKQTHIHKGILNILNIKFKTLDFQSSFF